MGCRRKNIYFICSQVDLSTKKHKVTGQSVITKYVHNILDEDYKIHLKLHSKNKLNAIFTLIKQTTDILFSFKKFKFSYFVISRSKFGFIRDSLLIFACLIRRTRVLVHIHGSDIIQVRNLSFLHRYFFYLLKFSINIVPSNTLKNELEKQGIKALYLSNFSTLFYLNKKKLIKNSNNKKEINILWNSNIMYSKGFYHLSEALLDIYNRGFQKFKFQILGRIIPDKDFDLSEYICKLKDNKFVDYLGPVDNEKSYKYLIESDIVALPSFYKTECQPLALIDAMTANKFLLISNNKYLLELTTGYPKLIFKLPLNINSMSEIINELLVEMLDKEFGIYEYQKLEKFKHIIFRKNLRKLINNL